MKVVFDTPVLIAAQISSGGVCAEAVRLALSDHEVIASDAIFDEFQRKLIDKFAFSRSVAKILRDRFSILTTIVTPAHVPHGVCRDVNDEPILGTAVAVECDVLISVDKDLLCLFQYRGVSIIKPGEFLKQSRTVRHR